MGAVSSVVLLQTIWLLRLVALSVFVQRRLQSRQRLAVGLLIPDELAVLFDGGVRRRTDPVLAKCVHLLAALDDLGIDALR